MSLCNLSLGYRCDMFPGSRAEKDEFQHEISAPKIKEDERHMH